MQSFRDCAIQDTHIAVNQIIEDLCQLGKLGLAFWQ